MGCLSADSASAFDRQVNASGASSTTASDFATHTMAATTPGELGRPTHAGGIYSRTATKETVSSNGTQPDSSSKDDVALDIEEPVTETPTGSEETLSSNHRNSDVSTNASVAGVSETLDDKDPAKLWGSEGSSLQVHRPKGPKSGRPRVDPSKYSTN